MPDPQMTPPPQYDGAQTSIDPTPKERVLGAAGQVISGLGGHGTKNPLTDAMDKQHAQRLAEVQLNQRNMATYGAILHSGQDPDLPADANGQHPPLTPERRQQFQGMYDASKAAYIKSGGKDPATKDMVNKHVTLIDHAISQGPGAKAAQPGIPPPPQLNASAMGPGGGPLPNNLPSTVAGTNPTNLAASGGGAGQPPSPKVPSQDPSASSRPQPPPPLDARMEAPRLRAKQEEERQDQRELKKKVDAYTAEHTLAHKFKMEEQAEALKLKAANPTGRATAMQPKTMAEARKLQEQGIVFKAADPAEADEDGNLNLGKYGDDMMIIPLQQNGRVVGYGTANQKMKQVSVGGVTYTIPEYNTADLATKGTALGPQRIGTTTRTTDPSTGQTTVSQHTPNVTGATGAGGGTQTIGGTRRPTPPPQVTPPSGGGSGSSATRPTTQSITPPLDEQGHIASDWKGAAPQVIEAANQLHDGKDMKEIGGTAKSKPLAEALARRTWGWSQDKFTPLEKTQIALATRYLNEAAASPALKSLDRGFFAQLPMIGATGEGKTGFGKAMTKLAAMGTSPEQQEFLRIYRQLAGTISGLGKLSRGGRITEATVNRLLSELPNPTNTTSSQDAIERINRLKDEVTTALSHDSFAELVGGRVAPAKGAPQPPPQVNARPLSPKVKAYLEANP
jgi:hypothetical protein